MKLALACDPAGLPLVKAIEEVLEKNGVAYEFLGYRDGESRDYPIYGVRAANMVAQGKADRGIILCGTGVGISMAANKVRGIRCCCCSDAYSIKYSRLHNDCNMLAMGGRVVGPETAAMLTEIFLTTPFEGGRHQRRIDMFSAVENGDAIE